MKKEIVNKIFGALKEYEAVTGQTPIMGDRALYVNVAEVTLNIMSFVSWWGFCRSVLGYTPDKESVTKIGEFVNRQASARGLITLPGETTRPLSPADKRRNNLLGRIQQYGYKPKAIFYGTDPFSLFFGQEFEYEFTCAQDLMGFIETLAPLQGFVYFKEDGSLTWPAVEVVTHPCVFDVATSLCRDITQAAIKWNATVTNCGHHVHVSRRAFTEKEVSAMIETVHNCWKEVISFSGRTEDEVKEFCADSFVRNCGRYAAVNVKNKATVEVRVMKARLNIDEAVDNLTFVRMLGNSVKEGNTLSLQSWLRARALAKENVQRFVARTPWTTTGVECKEKIKDEDEDVLNWLFNQEEPGDNIDWTSITVDDIC